MLYIASALTPTPIIDSLLLTGLTGPGSSSLVVAKPDKLEVWDISPSGLTKVTEFDVWGNILALSPVIVSGARPHFLVLLAPPTARLLLITSTSTSLIVTSSISLTPPSVRLRQQEFLRTVISSDTHALVSMWTGVLTCVEMELEKDKDVKARRASAAGMDVDGEEKRLKIKDDFNINIREHNLLHLTFVPSSSDPIVAFLSMSQNNNLILQPRSLSLSTHSFTDLSTSVDMVTPTQTPSFELTAETDFSKIAFSCPAARRMLAIPCDPLSQTKYILITGDEYSVLYSLSMIPASPKSPKLSMTASPRASAARRSPQTEMVSSTGKRRKGSTTTKEVTPWEVKPIWRIRQGFGTVLSAIVISSHTSGASVLLGDENGRLTAVGWAFERDSSILGSVNGNYGNVRVEKVDMGISSPPSSLTHIDGPHIFLASTCGDSHLLRLLPPTLGPPSPVSPSTKTSPKQIPRKGKGKARSSLSEENGAWDIQLEELVGGVEVLERWMNLAPVKDFCVVEEEGGGLSHLVVASGAANTNSLRLVRSGVGLEEGLVIEGLEGVERIWPINAAGSQLINSLLLSTPTSTILLNLQADISIVEIPEVIASKATIAAEARTNGLIVITAESVQVYSDLVGGSAVSSWEPGGEILAASIHGEHIVVGQLGGRFTVLKVSDLQPVLQHNIDGEISAVAIVSHPSLPSPVVAISTWTTSTLLFTLDSTTPHQIDEAYPAQSLTFRSSSSTVRLMSGLSDGSLAIYDIVSASEEGVTTTNRKVSSLGTRPLDLFPVSDYDLGEETIISIGLSERMSVIFESRDRIDFSSVSKKDIKAATSITHPTLGQCLVLASPSGLSMTKVNSLKKLHVQTLDLGDRSAGCLASLNEHKLLGVGSTFRSMDSATGEVLTKGYLELRDPNNLRLLDEMTMRDREEVTIIKPVTLSGQHYLAVGTAIFPLDDSEIEPYGSETTVNANEGRVLLVKSVLSTGVDGEKRWKWDEVDSWKVGGPVHDFAIIHGFLAVASGSKVAINLIDGEGEGPTEIGSWGSSFIAQHLSITPQSKLHDFERLVVGDGMRSISVLDVNHETGKIEDVQKDMATYSVVALERVRDGGEGVVLADDHSNLLTMRLNENIEKAATIGLHEDIARFRSGSLAPATSALDVIIPDLLFATTDGRLGMIGELTAGAAKTLDGLQSNMDKLIKGPGGISWKQHRKAGTELIEKDTRGFIDGDFVQRFLNPELSSAETKKMIEGSNFAEHVVSAKGEKASRSGVASILEAVAGMH